MCVFRRLARTDRLQLAQLVHNQTLKPSTQAKIHQHGSLRAGSLSIFIGCSAPILQITHVLTPDCAAFPTGPNREPPTPSLRALRALRVRSHPTHPAPARRPQGIHCSRRRCPYPSSRSAAPSSGGWAPDERSGPGLTGPAEADLILTPPRTGAWPVLGSGPATALGQRKRERAKKDNAGRSAWTWISFVDTGASGPRCH